MIIAPSILSADFSRLGEDIALVEKAGAQYLHIDVMDGHLVPNITFGAPVVKCIRPHSKMVFDTHLMISEPHRYIKDFVDAGSDIITIHIECESDIKKTLAEIRAYGKKAGLALNPDAELSRIEPFLGDFDMLLLMTVFAGFGGQKYIPEVNEKITAARKILGADFDIEVDGGISADNMHIPLGAGANILVAGSAIFGAEDPAEVVRIMRERA